MIVALLAVTACEGPEGPAGPTGPAGAAGPAGPVGPAGENSSQVCTDCHVNDLTMYAKQQQFALAVHGPGQYVRNSSSCAMCHTHQGFLERLETGLWAYSLGTVPDAMPTNCRTCHQIHTTYTASDYAFTAQDPVLFRVGNESIDLGAAGNLCAACHQQRERTGQMAVIDGPDVTFTSTHWGPHGSPQGNMFAGYGFYDFEGGLGGMFAHGTDARGTGCPTCHMADSGSLTTGGHTFEPATAGCETCHTDVEDFDKFGGQTTVQALLDELQALLVRSGIVDVAGHAVPGTYQANTAAAAWNFFGVVNDGSLGVHNPPYIKGILRGAIDAMGG